MKKGSIKKLTAALLALVIVLSFAGCAKINYVANGTIQAIKEVQDGSYKTGGALGAAQSASTGEEGSAEEDAAVIDALTPGTYGGVTFNTIEDVVNYYVAAYDKTKTQTAQYNTPSGAETWYALVGEESLSVHDILVEGSSNSLIDGLVPGIVSGLFKPSAQSLPPCSSRKPADDTEFATSKLTADDVLAANVKDNGDGTITLQIQPKAASMSAKGKDSQGRFFNALGDIGATVESISVLSWASGTTEENCVVDYKGGTGTITIDTASGTVTSADYLMKVSVTVQHASIMVIKDKSASLQVDYQLKFPASDEWLQENMQTTRA